MSKELGAHFDYTLELLAERLVTPERFGGAVILAQEVEPAEDPWPSLWG